MSHLHSIYFTDEEDDDQLPWPIQSNIESLRFHHPEFEHRLYRNDSGRAFIEEHFDRDVLDAFDELVPYSYKSDLLRFCLLHQLGGIYADVSVHFFSPLETDPGATKVKLFRDLFNQAPWIVSTSMIYSPPGVELFENCIRQIVENVNTGYYGFNPLCPTGPNLLGSEVAKWGQLDSMILGEANAIVRTTGGMPAGRTFVSETDTLVGVISKARSGLTSLGTKTRNNYNDFYARRKIYRREFQNPDVWTHRDYRERGAMNVSAVIDEDAGHYRFQDGCALFGPYIALPAGDYLARFIFEGSFGEETAKAARIDVCAGGDRMCAPQVAKPVPRDGGFELALSFTLETDLDNVEIRLFLQGERELTFDRLELTSRNAATS